MKNSYRILGLAPVALGYTGSSLHILSGPRQSKPLDCRACSTTDRLRGAREPCSTEVFARRA